jgi:two-component system, OmpR family, sensor kinase
MFSWSSRSREAGWSLSRRLTSRILTISFIITLFVTGTIIVHYGRDIPELQQRTVFDQAKQIAKDMPFDASGEELRASINGAHELFTRFPDAYEWHVFDANGDFVSSSVPTERSVFPAGLPPEEWDAPSNRGGWEAGKTFTQDGIVRHVVVVAHTDPGGLLFWLILDEAFMHILLPLAPFFVLILIFVSTSLRGTLKPLGSLAEQAKRVQSMEDIRPLDPKDAPLEVVELVKALNFSLEKLRTSIEAEKRFLQDAAHALRTPLAIVKARLELDGDKIDSRSLLEEVDGLIRLATQLLASANAERLVLGADARAELSALAHDAVSSMTPLAIRAGVDLGYTDDGQKSPVRGDADAISHALKNLIENALKFTPAGKSVTVHVSHDPPAIIVRDEGPGVPAHKAEAVFERHSRGKFGDGAGAGLGLSIVRRIMHAHGGQASLMLYDGPGASFQLAFPPAQIEAGANDDAPARAAVAA